MRWLLLALSSLAFAACEPSPIVVDVNPAGTQPLPLRGDVDVEGALTRDVVIQGKTFEKGTRVVVRETWILRRDPRKTPRGYRIGGHYDATQRSDGFVLPDDRADIYFVSALLPENVGSLPIPLEAFKATPTP